MNADQLRELVAQLRVTAPANRYASSTSVATLMRRAADGLETLLAEVATLADGGARWAQNAEHFRLRVDALEGKAREAEKQRDDIARMDYPLWRRLLVVCGGDDSFGRSKIVEALEVKVADLQKRLDQTVELAVRDKMAHAHAADVERVLRRENETTICAIHRREYFSHDCCDGCGAPPCCDCECKVRQQ